MHTHGYSSSQILRLHARYSSLSPILCGIWYKLSGIYTHVRADNESESTGKMESNIGERGEEAREGKGGDVIGSLMMREGGESELPGVNEGR